MSHETSIAAACSLVDEQLWRCAACDTLFEQGVADDLDGLPRCPQCGMAEGKPAVEHKDGEVIIRRTTRFR